MIDLTNHPNIELIALNQPYPCPCGHSAAAAIYGAIENRAHIACINCGRETVHLSGAEDDELGLIGGWYFRNNNWLPYYDYKQSLFIKGVFEVCTR